MLKQVQHDKGKDAALTAEAQETSSVWQKFRDIVLMMRDAETSSAWQIKQDQHDRGNEFNMTKEMI